MVQKHQDEFEVQAGYLWKVNLESSLSCRYDVISGYPFLESWLDSFM